MIDIKRDTISTHAPLAGRDLRKAIIASKSAISTHAPLAGRDGSTREERSVTRNFNPRAPCGARRVSFNFASIIRIFQPTRPLRGATRWSTAPKAKAVFQPTRPLRGATAVTSGLGLTTGDFNPRAPCGARQMRSQNGKSGRIISTHAPLAGRDSKSVQITMHIFAITDKFQMLLHRMPPVRAFCSFLMQENHADFGCEPPKWSLRACASHYKIIGSSGRYVCLQPKCSILFSYFLPK